MSDPNSFLTVGSPSYAGPIMNWFGGAKPQQPQQQPQPQQQGASGTAMPGQPQPGQPGQVGQPGQPQQGQPQPAPGLGSWLQKVFSLQGQGGQPGQGGPQAPGGGSTPAPQPQGWAGGWDVNG